MVIVVLCHLASCCVLLILIIVLGSSVNIAILLSFFGKFLLSGMPLNQLPHMMVLYVHESVWVVYSFYEAS